jgi:hypothetical protein
VGKEEGTYCVWIKNMILEQTDLFLWSLDVKGAFKARRCSSSAV